MHVRCEFTGTKGVGMRKPQAELVRKAIAEKCDGIKHEHHQRPHLRRT